MVKRQAESLGGQTARIETADGSQVIVLFGSDVYLNWVSGSTLNSSKEDQEHPEITGHVDTKDDYRDIKNAELILDDGRVFKITFSSPDFFLAYESINSRTHL
jgi:hypothetical protein